MTNIWIIKCIIAAGRAHTFSFQNKKTMEANTHFIVTAFYISTAHNVSQCQVNRIQTQTTTRGHEVVFVVIIVPCVLTEEKQVECGSLHFNYIELQRDLIRDAPAQPGPTIYCWLVVRYTVEIHYSILM